MIINMSGGGSPGKTVTVHVTPGTGANVTCTNGKKTFTGTTDANGDAVFKLTKGVWAITAENSGASISQDVSVMEDCTVNISLEQIPDFTYTGDYEIVNDNDTPITSTLGDWKIRFLTSGTLTFTDLNGAENGIDVFLVGGGGGAFFPDSGWQPGAAGGYTTVQESVMLEKNLSYQVSIGAGGTAGTSSAKAGGKTTAFGFTANGAEISGNNTVGGGAKPEFHDSSIENKYAGYGANGTEPVAYGTAGGGDCARNDGANGTPPTPSNAANTQGKPNTGGGGGGSVNGWRGGNGGSGIVIIRNAREVS